MTQTIGKGDRVRVKGIAGTGRVVTMWHQPGGGLMVKVCWYCPRSGRLIGCRVEAAGNVAQATGQQ